MYTLEVSPSFYADKDENVDKDEDVEERERGYIGFWRETYTIKDGGASSFGACLDSWIIDY